MPLYLYFKPAFNRSLKRLDSTQKKIIGKILEALEAYYSSGCDLSVLQEISSKFFYKQLRKPYYEAGIERNLRILIERDGEKCNAVLAGNHDQIKRFLGAN